MTPSTQQALRSARVLATFAIVGSSILALANFATHERIADNERQVVIAQLQEILPADSYNNALLDDRVSITLPAAISPPGEDEIHIARRDGQPVAAIMAVTAPNGYNGAIDLLVGIGADQKVIAVRVTKHRETPGLGDGIDIQRGDWIRQFEHTSLRAPERWAVRKDGGHFDQLTGATITPRAVVKAVHGALNWFVAHQEEIMSDGNER